MNIAIYTNILTPYRKYFYNSLYEECKKKGDNFHVIVMSDTEPNRNWKYDEYKTEYTIILNHKTITCGETYIHINNNLIKILKDLKLNILVCAGSYLCPGIWCALRNEKKLGYKTYFWSESHLNETRNYIGLKVRVREILRKQVYKKFDGFWYAGELSKQFIDTYCNPDAEFYFVPNLVEEEKYKKAKDINREKERILLKKYNIDENKTIFLCPARLSPVKGIDTILPILAKAKNKNNITILIAGDGELKGKIEHQAKEYDIDVRLLGFKNQESIIELYSIADVFLLPSLSDPNPLTCIEALWAQLPLFISTHCGNFPEVIIQGENGFYFDYKNEKNIIEKFDFLVSAPKEWYQNAKIISYSLAEEKYNSHKVVQRILAEMKDRFLFVN